MEKKYKLKLRPALGYNGVLCGGGGLADVGSHVWLLTAPLR